MTSGADAAPDPIRLAEFQDAERAQVDAARVLPRPVLLPLAIGGALAALAVAVGGVLVSGRPTGSELDRWMLGRLGLAPGSDPVGYFCSYWIGTLADPLPAAALILATALTCLVLRRQRLAVLVAVAPVTADLVVIGLKRLVRRTIHGDNLSYPSTHTAQGTALAMLAGLLVAELLGLRSRATVLLVVGVGLVAAGAMGWALVAGSVHYATDTLAGAGVALAVVPVTGWLVDLVGDRMATSGSG